jgi:type III restriction enzyme
MQTIGRGLRLPFGVATGNEDIDTLDIVAHDHYRELVDEIKNSELFKYRDLDSSNVEPTETVEVDSGMDDDQMSFLDYAFTDRGITSFVEVEQNSKTVEDLYLSYIKGFTANERQKKSQEDTRQISLFDSLDGQMLSGNNQTDMDTSNSGTHDTSSTTNVPISKEAFERTIKEVLRKSISVPKILVQTNSTVEFMPFTVKRNIQDFEVAMAKIERFDAVNQQLLSEVDAQILEVDDAMNTLACLLLDSISELSYDDADFILDVVNQYLALIEGDEEDKRRIVRRYASLIVNDLRKQIKDNAIEHTEDIYHIQKDLILFKKFTKSVKKDGRVKFDKPFDDKKNVKKYLFYGYKKSYYPENGFDSDTERIFSIILEEDPDVIRWIKPPLNQLGLFWQAGQQYNPDFLVETTNGKYMVEVKASNEVSSEAVVAKAREGIKWCKYASKSDPDKKKWEYRLISDDNIKAGNTCKYTLGTGHSIPEV